MVIEQVSSRFPPGSPELAYDVAKHKLDLQLSQVDGLDNKTAIIYKIKNIDRVKSPVKNNDNTFSNLILNNEKEFVRVKDLKIENWAK
jgi:hypothetical protein